tara:strand:- start:738 stop:953 length:216 start_codon:yes stop_codon:yes gene_type:complete
MTDTNGWSEYQQLVLHRLDTADDRLQLIESRLRSIENRVERITERLSITAAAFGFMAGAVPSIVIALTGGN